MDSSDDNEEFERRIGDLDRKLRVLEYNLSQASQDTIKDSLTPHQRHIDYLSEYEEEDYDECTLELPFMNKGKKPSTLTSGFKGGELKIEPLIGSLGIPAGIVSLDLNDYDENDFIDYDQDYSDSDEDSDDDSALDNAFNTNYNTDDDSENGDAGGIGGQSNVNGGSRNGKSTNYRDENGNSEHVRHYSGKQDGQNYKANNRTTRPATMPTYKASEPTALKVGNSPIFNPEKRWSDFATQRISELDIDPKTEPKRHSLVLSKSISNSGGFYIAMQDYIPDDTDYIQLLHGDLIKMKTDWGVNLHTLEQGKIDPKYLLGVTAEVVVEMLTKMNISQVVLKDIEGLVDGFDENTNIDTFNPREDPEDIIPIPKLRSYKSSHCIESEDPTLFFCWKEKSDRVAVFGSFNNYEKVVPLFFDSVSKVFVAFCESVQSNGDYCYFRFLVDDVWRTDQSIPQQLVGDEVYNYLLMTCGEIQGRLAITKYEPVRFKILPRMILLDQCEANSSEFNLDSSQIYLAIEELMVINEEFKHLRVDSGISVSSKMIANECTEPLLNSASTLGDIHYACYTYQCKNDGLCYSLSCSKPTLIGTNWNGSSNTSSALKVKRTKPLSLYIPVEPALPGEDDFINRNSLVLGPLVSPTNSNGSDYDMEFGHKSIECLVEDYIKRVDPTYDIYEKLSELGNVLEPSDSSIELLNTDDWYSPTMKGSSGPVDKEFTLDNSIVFLK